MASGVNRSAYAIVITGDETWTSFEYDPECRRMASSPGPKKWRMDEQIQSENSDGVLIFVRFDDARRVVFRHSAAIRQAFAVRVVREFLAKRVPAQPPYSPPDLHCPSGPDLFLFPKIKTACKRTRAVSTTLKPTSKRP